MKRTWLLAAAMLLPLPICGQLSAAAPALEQGFVQPPPEARPWVYWYFMDGNLTREGLTADLEAMRDAGIGGAIFLEVDLGLPRGPVKFMSPEWRRLLAHAVHEAERLGIEIILGSGPGWCGTGGPWVQPDQSMQHLVAGETNVTGPAKFDAVLDRPAPRVPFFGEGTLTPEFAKQWREFQRDVAVLAFPQPKDDQRLADADEKALYKRGPYSSFPGVRSALPTAAEYPSLPAEARIAPDSVVDLTGKMSEDGRLQWDVPPGKWTILRFCRTVTGQITRPSPQPGLGFETDKFNPAAVDAHLDTFVGGLLKEIGTRKKDGAGGLSTLHFDSWEMSSQNWSQEFRNEFQRRRGYDPLRYLPAFTGRIVDSVEVSERFLWDVRQTAQELVIENHVSRLRDFAHRQGMQFSCEPYDMNPTADLSMGAVADVPMGEFWWQGFDTAFSVIEAASIAHTGGRQVVAAEAFTSEPGEDWQGYPANIKPLGDWAFAAGINRVAFHRYQHQPWLDRWPGMRMGPYGVHWERTQTWWPMVSAYHSYLARCQFLLRQGRSVADILFLNAEGAPQVFRAPASATIGQPPDRRGHNFDGCAPDMLIARAKVENGQIVFPGGTSYRVLVLPDIETMSPALLRKVGELAAAGATIVGPPPKKSPSLAGYPKCDDDVRELADELWNQPAAAGKGRVVWGPEYKPSPDPPASGRNPLDDAKWIWFDENQPGIDAPVCVRYFQREVGLPADAVIESATACMTADNGFALSINGQEVGKGDNFNRVSRFDLKDTLQPGKNSLVVRANNGGTSANPAGLVGAIDVLMRSGLKVRWQTDGSWTASEQQDSQRKAARVLGSFGMSPWNKPTVQESGQIVSIRYSEYGALARLIESAGVPPDFESDGAIRYTHRTDGGTEIYFVSNRNDRPVDANCMFRVAGKQPELWHPVSGQCRSLTTFTIKEGRTSVPLRFEANEAYFVVFRSPAAESAAKQTNFAGVTPLKEITGPWQVSFDPKWGGPEQASFANLDDWTRRPEPGIKFYSGQATYRKTIELPDRKPTDRETRLLIDLGKVRNIARVRLNGHDLGVAWCAPWRVDITDSAKPGENELEITVANLWINRLIGDSGLPQEKRLTWTSVNPFKPDSPLSPSGLLGPVTIQQAAEVP